MKTSPLAYIGILSPIIYGVLELKFRTGHLAEWDYGDWFVMKFWLFQMPLLSLIILLLKKQKRPIWFVLTLLNSLILAGMGIDLIFHMIFV